MGRTPHADQAVAQTAERRFGEPEAAGSCPASLTKQRRRIHPRCIPTVPALKATATSLVKTDAVSAACQVPQRGGDAAGRGYFSLLMRRGSESQSPLPILARLRLRLSRRHHRRRQGGICAEENGYFWSLVGSNPTPREIAGTSFLILARSRRGGTFNRRRPCA